MLLRAGHVDGGRVVHLTHTSLVVETLCGAVVDCDGEPDLAVPCPDCEERAHEDERAAAGARPARALRAAA